MLVHDPYVSLEALAGVAEKAARIVAAEVGRYLRGEPLTNCANPDALASHRTGKA